MKPYRVLLLAALASAACVPLLPTKPISNNNPPTPPLVPSSTAAVAPAAWVQFVPGGVEARAVVTSGDCPSLLADGKPLAMTLRAAADANFPLLCFAPLPLGLRSLLLEPHSVSSSPIPLPIPNARPERILVFGDTGCRIKGKTTQACNDPRAWPFASIARAAATLKPDLVLHVGDYLYREALCPEGDLGCAGSPHGDNWPTWSADFFAPAAPLLAVAPWILVRGNHEDCNRSGLGYLRLIGPTSFDPSMPCTEHLSPWTAHIGEQTLAVMDNASAPDTTVDARLVSDYAKDFKALGELGHGQKIWLASHRPIFAAISGPLGLPVGGSATLIAAAGDLDAFKAISLMLSGHIHSFEAINYQTTIPPQIVAGFGGDNLDITPKNLKGTIFQGQSGVQVKDGVSVGGFGFLLMTRSTTGWTIQLYDPSGAATKRCQFAGGRVDCPDTK